MRLGRARVCAVALTTAVAFGFSPSEAFAGPDIELTPYVGFRSSASLSDELFRTREVELDDSLRVGLRVGLSLDAKERWWGEFAVEQEDSEWIVATSSFESTSDVEMLRYSLGLRREWERRRSHPFVFANAGATTFETTSFRTAKSSQPTIGLGGGASISLSDRLALRVDGEFSVVRIAETDNDFAACLVASCARPRPVEMWSHFQLRVGITYRFDR